MGHMHHKDKRDRFSKTPPEWLPFGSQAAEIVGRWANRSDIVAFVGEGAGHGAPACWIPSIAEMEVDTSVAFEKDFDPSFLGDFTDRQTLFDHPVVAGALLHEAGHARFTKWDLAEAYKTILDDGKKKNRPVAAFERVLVEMFEETREEKKILAKWPENRFALRACSLKLVLGDLLESRKEDPSAFGDNSNQGMSQLVLLTLARVDAGTLDPADVKFVADQVNSIWGESVVADLREVWLDAQSVRDDDWRSLWKLAKKWVKILDDSGNSPTEESESAAAAAQALADMLGEMQPGDGDGEGEGEGQQQGAGGSLADAAETTAVSAAGEGVMQDAKEQEEERVAKEKEESRQREQESQTEQQVFGRGTGPAGHATSSRLVEKRKPRGEERASAVQLAKDLERARYVDRSRTIRKQAIPAGKLNMRGAVQAAADRKRGAMTTATPWRAIQRRMSDDPDLTVGVMVDISGSMHAVMQQMGGLTWILSEAVRRVQGSTATVYFGNAAFPGSRKGQHLEEVEVYSASDGTERFQQGWEALNSHLGLLGRGLDGAKLLIVVSDLYHQGHENRYEQRVFAQCAREGVAVVIVTPDERMMEHASQYVGENAQVMPFQSEDMGTARRLGGLIVKELGKRGRGY